MGGYWIDSPDNPFNQMSYTRGGGGYDNRDTHESNDRRSHAMEGAGAAALPHFANAGVAQAYYPGKGLAVVDGNVIRTTGPGSSGQSTLGGSGGSGAGSAGVSTGGGGKGAGSRLVLSGSPPLKVGYSDEATGIFMGGDWWQSNPWWSDVEAWGQRYGEPGEWLGGAVTLGADAVFNVARAVDSVVGSRIVTDRSPVKPIQYGDGLATVRSWIGEVSSAYQRQSVASEFGALSRSGPGPATVTVKPLPPIVEPGWKTFAPWFRENVHWGVSNHRAPGDWSMHMPGR